jgi:acetyltransferase-like isoleucine patch superfamily enzyme
LDCRGDAIHIGNYVDISSDAIVYTLTHDIQSRDFAVVSGRVDLSDNVWVCSRAIVLPKTSIGIGSVVGANSVVKGSIPDHQLWQGNPAVLRKELPVGRGSARRC